LMGVEGSASRDYFQAIALLLPDEAGFGGRNAFEERLLTRFAHVPSGTRTSYRRGVLLQARQLAGLVLGYADEYRPVSWR
ncbi:MAG: CRISPR-associated endonuclease Cas1, partial [Actinomycetota bacterium]